MLDVVDNVHDVSVVTR